MEQKKQFRPANLRTLLAVLLAIIILGGGAIFYLGLNTVRDYAAEVNQKIADANASSKQVESLQALKNQLSQSTSLIDQANRLFVTPETYQSQALTDIKSYADAAGLSVDSTAFSEAGNTVTITLKNPVTFTRLITFLTNIESNLPKLQVSSLSLGPPENSSANNVTTNDIKINVSVRQ